MQSSSPEHRHAPHSHPTPQRLKLFMPSAVTHSHPSHGLSLDTSMTSDGSTSPVQPTWSPLTPTSSQADFEQVESCQRQAANHRSATHGLDHPPQSLNLEENPDAIALRNAISILQIQRQQSIKDIQALEHLRHAALEDPQGFVSDLKDNKLARPPKTGVDVDYENSEDESSDSDPNSRSKFGTIPAAQNVVRCPPVNWDKYHVVGESLDRLHERQRNFPGVTEEQIRRSGHPPKHTIAAPYRPGIDRLEEKITRVQGRT
jgi:hypothetical protein